jgi:lipopolysaccharide/colanic/teichoic acid biosynthesis glycosyltransferase
MYSIVIKRLLDIILSFISLIVLSPVFLFAAIGVWISDPGPVLYHSERVGSDYKPFHFYKFRSMKQTKHDKGLYIADPERVFPFGKLIRRLKIDELPQLINIIKGDMSIVGPRPLPLETAKKHYCGKYAPIIKMRPGLTSAASLYDYMIGDTYNDDEAYQREVLPVKLEMELYYIKHESFMYDFNLIIRTAKTILKVASGDEKFNTMPEYMKIKNKIRKH